MKRILTSLGMIAVVALVVTSATGAFFSDTATSTTSTFSSGTLSIDNNEFTTATALNIPNIAPGQVSDPYTIIIRNDGNMNLGWLGDWQFSGGVNGSTDLKDALYVASAKMQFRSPTDQNWLNDTTSGYESDGSDWFIKDGTGHGPYPAWFTSLASASSFGVVSLNKFNDNAGMVPGSVYEHAGALKPGYTYKLTVQFGMAAGAGNDYQNLGPVTAKLQVNATQIDATALTNEGVPAATAPGLVTWMNSQIADQTEP